MGIRAWTSALVLGTATGLGAYGGTPEAWLGGTLGWDTVPFKEADLELYSEGADGRPAWGLGVQAGLWDRLQAHAAGRWTPDGGAPLWEWSLQAREGYFRHFSRQRPSSWFPPSALYARGAWDGARWGHALGWVAVFSAAIEASHSLVVNVEAPLGSGGAGLRGGYWSPYWAETLRLGLEWALEPGLEQRQVWIPQALFNGPGDLSLSLGLRLDPAGSLPARALARLSYQLFPDP